MATAVVDAGQGIAQSRTRLIILAAAPGQVLPSHPPQDFVSEGGNTRLSMPSGLRGRERVVEILSSPLGSAAILRAPMVRDAIGDLGVPANSIRDEALLPASSPFQVTVREGALRLPMEKGDAPRRSVAHDHVTRPIGEVDAARIQAVPKDHPGADWHLMRNQAVTLPSGATIRRAFFIGRDMSTPQSRAAAQVSMEAAPTVGTIQSHDIEQPSPQPAQFPRAI